MSDNCSKDLEQVLCGVRSLLGFKGYIVFDNSALNNLMIADFLRGDGWVRYEVGNLFQLRDEIRLSRRLIQVFRDNPSALLSEETRGEYSRLTEGRISRIRKRDKIMLRRQKPDFRSERYLLPPEIKGGVKEEAKLLSRLINARRKFVNGARRVEDFISDWNRYDTIKEIVSDVSYQQLAENPALAEKRLNSAVGNEGNDEAILSKCLELCYQGNVALAEGDRDFLFLLKGVYENMAQFESRGLNVPIERFNLFYVKDSGEVSRYSGRFARCREFALVAS